MTTRFALLLTLAVSGLAGVTNPAEAQIPRTISYQGFLVDDEGVPMPDGPYAVTFRFYEGFESDVVLWEERITVPVQDGYFSALIGSSNPLELSFDRQYFLTLQPEGREESVRLALASTPYSLIANDVADGVAVRSLNGITDTVELEAGEGIEIERTEAGLRISSRVGLVGGCSGDDCSGPAGDVGLFGSSTAATGRGVSGFGDSPGGQNYGVFGLTRSSAGYGVSGWANAKVGVTYGIFGMADSREGYGLYGLAPSWGVYGLSTLRSGPGRGVYGEAKSEDGAGVEGQAPVTGVRGLATAPSAFTHGVRGESASLDGAGVYGRALAPSGINSGVYGSTDSFAGSGVYGIAPTFGLRGHARATTGRSHGVYGSAISLDGRGVLGLAPTYGVYGQAEIWGVFGSSRSLEESGVAGVYGKALSPEGFGVYGTAPRFGVYGIADTTAGDTYGVYGISKSPAGTGVYGIADTTEGENYGVYGTSKSPQGYGVYGLADTTQGRNYGVYGETLSQSGVGVFGKAEGEGFAGWFEGKGFFDSDLLVSGSGLFDSLIKAGGIFLIDHPLDPENKYLAHSFVESPDMTNLYTGTTVTDENGFATVRMPDWFEVLNRDIRYQLTVIGQFAQAIVAEEVRDLEFVIQTDKPRVKVSWQVTGVRQDRWAEENRFIVERDKSPANRGRYLNPEAFGLPASRGLRLEGNAELELLGPVGIRYRRGASQ